MTLLIGYTTPEYVVLASDRMITWTMLQSNSTAVAEKRYKEQTTKTLLFRGQWLIAFSGVADLGGNTEVWLVDRLAEICNTESEVIWWELLGKELRSELERLDRDPAAKGFSLMACGYGHLGESDDVVPLLRVVSNRDSFAYGGSGVSDFRALRVYGPTVETGHADTRMWAVGSPPSQRSLEEASDAIRRFRKREPQRALEVSKMLARVIIERSRTDPGVGSTVQVGILPRAAAGGGYMSIPLGLPAEPLQDAVSLEYSPRRLEEPRIEALNLIVPGMTFTGIQVSTEEPGPREPFGPPAF